MKGLIVNADDFGFSKEINEGICEAHIKGIVTDTSLLVRSPYAGHAVSLAKQCGLPIGLHIDLVTPYSQTYRAELGPNGHLAQELFNREYKNHISSLFSCEELLKFREEIQKQIDDFCKLVGQKPSHLDYHFGLHYLPDIMVLYLLIAQEHGLPVRWGVQYAGANPLVLAPARLCDRFRGLENGGKELFLSMLDEPWDGALEVLCHPGYHTREGLVETYNVEREYELKTLTDPLLKSEVLNMGIQLVNYGWLKDNHHR